MVEVKKEITKEFYEQYADMPKKDSWEAVGELLGMAITAGYGLYGYNFFREGDNYYLIYERGSSCD